MELWRLSRQVAYLASLVPWPDAPAATILTSAFVSEDHEGNFFKHFVGGSPAFLPDGPVTKTPPFARVRIGAAGEGSDFVSSYNGTVRGDLETPGRYDLAVVQLLVTVGPGVAIPGTETTVAASGARQGDDSHGLYRVTGDLRDFSGGGLTQQGKSQGRDVEEVARALMVGMSTEGAFVDSTHGFSGQLVGVPVKVAAAGVQNLVRRLDLHVHNATLAPFYHNVYRLTGVDAGAHRATLSWTAAPRFYDTTRVLVVYKAGATAPTSIFDGTASYVALGTTSTTIAVGAGTWSFAVWNCFDETGSGTDERFSTVAATKANLVVA